MTFPLPFLEIRALSILEVGRRLDNNASDKYKFSIKSSEILLYLMGIPPKKQGYYEHGVVLRGGTGLENSSPRDKISGQDRYRIRRGH